MFFNQLLNIYLCDNNRVGAVVIIVAKELDRIEIVRLNGKTWFG
jgi:hypothetical protein